MVRGRGIAVTAVALTYQCADTTRIARGRGTEAPNVRHASVKRLRSIAFIGLPWPRKAAGIRGMVAMEAPRCCGTRSLGQRRRARPRAARRAWPERALRPGGSAAPATRD